MIDPKDLPAELQHLIEKRAAEKDRRQSGRADARKPGPDAGEASAEERRKTVRRHSD